MKYQRKIIKFIFGMVLVCAIISPALALELGVDVLPGELQIVSTDPSEIFEIYVDEAQTLSIVLDRDVTAIWYEDSVEIRTDHNTTNSSYYFTSSIEENFVLTVSCNDSFTGLSQVNFSWFISVVPAVSPYPTPPRANVPVYPYIPPVEPEEDIVDEEEDIVDGEVICGWKIPKEWYVPGILITYLNLWEEPTRPWIINTLIEVLEMTDWKFPEYTYPEFNLLEYEIPEITLPEYETIKAHIPEELNVLSEVDRVIMGLALVFLILFVITMKGGPSKSTNPGRRAPIKI